MRVRCLYLDLDGTLLGQGASLLHDGEGLVSVDGVRPVAEAAYGSGVYEAVLSTLVSR